MIAIYHRSVIPPGAIEGHKMYYRKQKKYSIISASRIEETKGIDLLIAGVIRGTQITIHIYIWIYTEKD